MAIGQSAGKSFAYLLGVYLGDGCVTVVQGYPRFRLNTIDRDFAEATARAIEDVTGQRANINGPYKDKRFPKAAEHYELTSCNRKLCDALEAATAKKREWPDVSAWSHDEKLAFAAGLLDSEGFVAENKTQKTNRRFYMGFRACNEWVPKFAAFLESLGIRTGKLAIEKPYREGYKIPMRFGIKMASFISAGAYFKTQRKQSRVNEWGSRDAYEMRAVRPRKAKANLNEHTQGAARP